MADGGADSIKLDGYLYMAGVCDGRVAGIFDMSRLDDSLGVCPPARVIYGQVTRVVLSYLDDHPEQLHEQSSTLTLRALQSAFPCR